MYVHEHVIVPCVVVRAVRAEQKEPSIEIRVPTCLVAYTETPISPASVDENSPLLGPSLQVFSYVTI